MAELIKKKKSATRDLTTGSPMKLIVSFMIPLFLGILFQQLYSMADTMVVGKFLGVNALAGVGSTGSINFLILGFCMGICQGCAIPISQKFGEGDYDGLRRYVGNIVWLSSAVAVVMTLAVCLLCKNILVWMDTPAEVFEYAYDYIFIIFLGIPVTFIYNTLSGLIRALGDSKSPVYFLVIASVLNIILDIVFIVVFHMGVAGAAWATVISQLVSGVLCFFYIVRKFEILHLKREDMTPSWRHIKNLLWMSIPMGLQYSITAIGSTILQVAVNALGAASVASMTAAFKVQILMVSPFDAMGTTMATYGGQNVGAGKLRRIDEGLKSCSILGVGYSVLACVLLYFFADKLVLIFLDAQETEIISQATHFLFVNSLLYIPLAFVNILRLLIQGLGFSKLAMFAGVFEMAARTFVALVFVPKFGFNAVCFANPSAWLMADVFLFPAYFYVRKILHDRIGLIPESERAQVRIG